MTIDKNVVFLAVDLGAESGRVVAGNFDGARITLEEVHRFPNGPVNVRGSLFWDFLGLWKNVKAGLTKAAALYGDRVAGIGLDTCALVDLGTRHDGKRIFHRSVGAAIAVVIRDTQQRIISGQ